MKSLLTLSIVVAILALPKPSNPKNTFTHREHRLAPSASSSWRYESSLDVVRKEFQAGPFFLRAGLRTTQHNPAEDSISPISRIAVSTGMSASLDPLSIGVTIVLNLETKDSAASRESALIHIPNAKCPPDWEGFRGQNDERLLADNFNAHRAGSSLDALDRGLN